MLLAMHTISACLLTGILWFMFTRCTKVERDQMFVVLAFIGLCLLFFTLYEQTYGSWVLFSDRVMNQQALGVRWSAAELTSPGAFFILVLAPFFAWLWPRLDARGGLIGGLAQDGEWRMDARFPRAELISRIENIARKRRAIHLRKWDAERFVLDYLPRLPKSSLVYCDPPYFEKAERLYINHYQPEDHHRIAKIIQRIKLPWMVSYDSAPEILECYGRRRAFLYGLQYNASKVHVGTEVFFLSDRLKLASGSAVPAIDRVLSSPTPIIRAAEIRDRLNVA